MKKVICFILIFVMVLVLCACGDAGDGAGQKMKGLNVGFGRELILPEGPVHIGGSDVAGRVSTGYMDMLYTTCVAITKDSDTVLVYTMDFLSMADNFAMPAKEAITAATGIPVENILMNATHTHSGVGIAYNYEGIDAYRTMFNEACVKAATTALADRSAAEAYAGGVQTEGLTFVRHYLLSNDTYAGANFGDFQSANIADYACEADNELQLIKFARAAEDKKDIVMMSFGTHPTYNGQATNMTLSADFPGAARDYVEANSDSLVAYFAGSLGNQEPKSKISGQAYAPNDYKKHGEKLGEYAVNALSTLGQTAADELELVHVNYTADSNKDKVDKAADAQKVVGIMNQHGKTSAEVQAAVAQYGFSSVYEATAIKSRVEYPETMEIPLSAISLGDLSLIFVPYEMSSVHGMAIKEQSPFANTFVVNCADNHQGYIPTAEAYDYGAYEAHVSRYAKGTGEKLVEEYIRILGTLKNG